MPKPDEMERIKMQYPAWLWPWVLDSKTAPPVDISEQHTTATKDGV